MKVKVFDYPPNWEEIKRVLNPKRGVVFTFGDTIYNPSGGFIPDHLLAHEETHQKQQKNPKKWWDRYLKDKKFRLNQELEAYRQQWKVIKETRSRPERRKLLKKISKDLASPLYGSIISEEEAIEKIQ